MEFVSRKEERSDVSQVRRERRIGGSFGIDFCALNGENRSMAAPSSFDVADISPLAWRLLRVAAGYDQRSVEREVDDIVQAHISMLESGTRALSRPRREELFELYAAELDADQIEALTTYF
ncbi:hypothetical protein GL213_06175 [Halogeometricum borinquense]|uniref:Helix-turn-helix domain-containing protein n=1 Tax=Halogeometricum borinquense TaxID=60847 RepID=A0A6C0ULV0_9EURY|nr:hypothetical protein G3I44_11565 [Halogeometricum borinquense]QIQ76142.1 hypothetical protein GL213_06175 [Halogeometricum borinquense]